ncbi:conserved Plasmodium protein, unknown function [Plasmodium vinckei brucechwatti]|uniref:Uncharacterized protein n=1 Tax=Plasmodium vinckei brucechwatti TaxID=119398 RepID=A0A6V7S6U4_PLAVN|nr:conserved Plasmodium protein, unknown function [Plasmodium vinckei brucechwatti]
MPVDKLRIACYGDKNILRNIEYFFKDDFYEIHDVKLDEKINKIRVNLQYEYYNNSIAEYFKNDENISTEKAFIYIYFLYSENLEEYKNEKEYLLNRYKDSINEESEDCIFIYLYNLEDNVNEIKNIKKIKSDFSSNSYKTIKILSVPIIQNEEYNTNEKVKELYEHFKIRYIDHIKICIEKKYHSIKSSYNKSINIFLSYVEVKKKVILEKKKKKFCISNTCVEEAKPNNISKDKAEEKVEGKDGANHNEINGISEFVAFYKNHNIFSFCNECVDINFFLQKNDVHSYINKIEFVTDYDEQLYLDMYDIFLSVFMWGENLCALYLKLNLFKKCYMLYSSIERLFFKHLNVYIKKKKCIIHSPILFEKYKLAITRYIYERNVCSIHLLEYIFFKKFTLLLFLNKFSYISIKALKFAQFFYKNKIFIFMHNFSTFRNSVNKYMSHPNYIKYVHKKIAKYKKKELAKKNIEAKEGIFKAPIIKEKTENLSDSIETYQKDVKKNEQTKEDNADEGNKNTGIIVMKDNKPCNNNNINNSNNNRKGMYKFNNVLVRELNEIFSQTDSNEPLSVENILKKIIINKKNRKNEKLIEKSQEEENNESKNGEHTETENILCSNEPQTSNEVFCDIFKNENEKLLFLLNCCFMNKEKYFSIYFYNLGNLIKFLFERKRDLHIEKNANKLDQKTQEKGDKIVKHKNTNISKYLSLQKNIMKLGYKKSSPKNKKKSKSKLQIENHKESSCVENSSSACSNFTSSALSEKSESKNNDKLFLYTDFSINVSNIFKLSFIILKNILNINANTFNNNPERGLNNLGYNEINTHRMYLFNFFYNYLEEKKFEKHIESVIEEEIIENKKNIYNSFPIYHIKAFSKDSNKQKNYLLINIMNKIINLYSRKHKNIYIINKFFLAILLFENKLFKKSFHFVRKIIEESPFHFLTQLCMQLLLFHDLNNKFYHFCASYFLANKYTKIISFKNVNINFTSFQNYEFDLFSMTSQNSILKLEQNKSYYLNFYDALERDIITFNLFLKNQLKDSKENKENKNIPFDANKKGTQFVRPDNNTNKVYLTHGEENQNKLKFLTNKMIKFETKKFCKDNYYFNINKKFLNSLKKFNFSVSKNEKNNIFYMPTEDIKIFVQSDYNLYMFVPNMVFGVNNKAPNEKKNTTPSCDHINDIKECNINNCTTKNNAFKMYHLDTLLANKIKEYAEKKNMETKTDKIQENVSSNKTSNTIKKNIRIKNVCAEYDEYLDLFVFSAFTKNLNINNIILQLYSKEENKYLYIKYSEGNYVIKDGLNLIKLNIINILESNKIKWENFCYKIKYVFLKIKNFALYQKIGILPNDNLMESFIKTYVNFINNNNIIINKHNSYTTFFLNQLVSPLYIKIKPLNSILNCKINASYINKTSLVYDNINYVKLVIKKRKRIQSKNKNLSEDIDITCDETDEVSNLNQSIIKNNPDQRSGKFIQVSVKNKNQTNECNDIKLYNTNVKDEILFVDLITFYIEQNENIDIENLKILNDQEMDIIKHKDRNTHMDEETEVNNCNDNVAEFNESSENDWNKKNNKTDKQLESTQAIISFIPRRKIDSEIGSVKNNEQNMHDNLYKKLYAKSSTSTDKIEIKCIINNDICGKKRKQRKTDIYKIKEVNYIGKIKIDNFINHDQALTYTHLNNKLIVQKKFKLVNIFNEKINTYRSKNGMLYELILNLNNNNYSVFLKKFNIEILKKNITQIKNVKIFFLNNEKNEDSDSKSLQNEITSFHLKPPKIEIINKDTEKDLEMVEEKNIQPSNHVADTGKEICNNFNANIISDKENDETKPKNFYDEISINSWIKGGESIFLLFEVQYKNIFDKEDNCINHLKYENAIGNINISYEYRNQNIYKIDKYEKKYIYNLLVFIPQFLLSIDAHYDIPKTGILHSNININVILSNKINEDIYIKYFVCIDNNNSDEKQNNCATKYNWLISGFKKQVVCIPKNSSHVINLMLIPLKVGLINFPPISYFIKLNNTWIEITQFLNKSENFQVIISPPLNITPQIWQLM